MILRILPAIILASTLCADDQAPAPFNTQEITIPFLKPAEALKAIAVPKGFRVQLAAAEPWCSSPSIWLGTPAAACGLPSAIPTPSAKRILRRNSRTASSSWRTPITMACLINAKSFGTAPAS